MGVAGVATWPESTDLGIGAVKCTIVQVPLLVTYGTVSYACVSKEA